MIKKIGLALLVMASSSVWAGEFSHLKYKTLDGEVIQLSDLKGKWVVLNYWATWCPPCLKEIPELIGFHEERKNKDAVVIGINYEQIDKERLKEFSEMQMIDYPVVAEKPSRTTPFGPIRGLPTTVMIDPDGNGRAFHTGEVTAEMLSNFIEKNSN